MSSTQRTALVSGANKGLGFEISKQLAKKGVKVVVTARDPKKGEQAVRQLQKEGLDVLFCPMDVTSSKSIKKAKEFVEKELGGLDILVNNAGIFVDQKAKGLDVDEETVRKTFETNTLGHLLVSQAFIPLMKKNGYGRIVNMSSGLGTLNEMESGYPGYRISKAALNAVTRILASELKGTNLLVNSMCPGWCRTDMGGSNADRSVEKGAETAVFLATLSDGGPTGKYFRDRKEISW